MTSSVRDLCRSIRDHLSVLGDSDEPPQAWMKDGVGTRFPLRFICRNLEPFPSPRVKGNSIEQQTEWKAARCWNPFSWLYGLFAAGLFESNLSC